MLSDTDGGGDGRAALTFVSEARKTAFSAVSATNFLTRVDTEESFTRSFAIYFASN